LQRTRGITTVKQHGGADCPAYLPLPGETCSSNEELLAECACNTQDCPVDCVLEAWTSWGDCSTTCGDGEEQRSRGVDVQPAHGGVACAVGAQHYGEKQGCFLAHCPIHGVWEEWEAWGSCSTSCGDGEQERERLVKIPAQHGGIPVDGEALETRQCIVKECPIHCEVGAWENHGDCSHSCGGGEQKQKRAVTTEANHGGVACPETEQIISCSADPCPIDCVLTNWAEDGGCSKSCGGGKQRFVRSVDVQPAHGGRACEDGRDKEEDCEQQTCPVDCVVSQWSAWGACSTTCAEGSQVRRRQVTTYAAHGGAACPPDLSEDQACRIAECPVHCELSAWAEWSSCSTSCGGDGNRGRTRSITVDPLHGGQICDDLTDQDETCAPDPCPIHCELGDWYDTSACSVSCGDGSLEMVGTLPSLLCMAVSLAGI